MKTETEIRDVFSECHEFWLMKITSKAPPRKV